MAKRTVVSPLAYRDVSRVLEATHRRLCNPTIEEWVVADNWMVDGRRARAAATTEAIAEVFEEHARWFAARGLTPRAMLRPYRQELVYVFKSASEAALFRLFHH